jgi:transcription elongation factor Elf1
MAEITKTQVCKCENCGNEAEMTFTCTLTEEKKEVQPQHNHQVKGTATCTHCGNEAEMWIDY